MKTSSKVGIMCGYVAVCLVVITLLFYGWAYPKYVWNLDKAQNELDIAAADANLNDIAHDLNVTLQYISGFSGNPNAFYAQPNTDFNLIKLAINDTIHIALTEASFVRNSGTPNDQNYSNTVANIHNNLLPNIGSRISDAEQIYQQTWTTQCGIVWICETYGMPIAAFLLFLFLITRDSED